MLYYRKATKQKPKMSKTYKKTFQPFVKSGYIRSMIFLLIMLLAVYVIVPRIGEFRSSLVAFHEVDIALLCAAFGGIMLSVSSAALAYKLLAFTKLSYGKILLTQWASMFVNRLLPAGVGGIGLFVYFFHRHERKLAKATAIVAINSFLGFLAHATLFAVAVIFFTLELPHITLPQIPLAIYIIVVTVLFGVLLVARHMLQKKLSGFLQDTLQSLLLFRKRPVALLGGFLGGIGNSGFHLLALYITMRAFGVDLPWEAALVVLTGGVAAATAAPTPGGVAGSEAGVTAVLVAYGIDPGVALAVALGYRLVSYWIPLLPGVFAFWLIQRRRYI